MLQIITGLVPNQMTFKTFRSLYSHALLIIAKSSQFL